MNAQTLITHHMTDCETFRKNLRGDLAEFREDIKKLYWRVALILGGLMLASHGVDWYFGIGGEEMSDRDPNHLCEPLRVIYQEWLDRCTTAGLQVKAIVTWRSALDQSLAKQQGLSNAGAGSSPHNVCDANGNPNSYAFDFAVFEDHGVYITDGSDPRYKQAGEIGKQLGLVWGGDWLHPDFDHLEMQNWKDSTS